MNSTIIVALIGAVAAVVTAYFGYKSVSAVEANKKRQGETDAVLKITEFRMDYWERRNAALQKDLDELKVDLDEERSANRALSALNEQLKTKCESLEQQLRGGRAEERSQERETMDWSVHDPLSGGPAVGPEGER